MTRSPRRATPARSTRSTVPDVLAGVSEIDTSCQIMGRDSALPLVLSPTALQRAFHRDGERAVAQAAARFGIWFGISSLATHSIEEIAALTNGPKLFQLYVHKDKGFNASMIERCREAQFDALALTVDTIVSGKRERCLRSGFTTPPRFSASSLWSYATRPRWTLDYVFGPKFRLPNLDGHVEEGSGKSVSIQDYFNTMLDTNMDWDTAARIRQDWGGTFALKGVMSAGDASRGRDRCRCDLDFQPWRTPARRQPRALRPADGDRRGRGWRDRDHSRWWGAPRHAYPQEPGIGGDTAAIGRAAISLCACRCGPAGVERAVQILKEEIERGMRLMGVTSIDQLDPDRLASALSHAVQRRSRLDGGHNRLCSGHRRKAGTQLAREKFRLLPRREVPALVHLVPINEIGERSLDPLAWRGQDLSGKGARRRQGCSPSHRRNYQSFPNRAARRRRR